MLAPAQLFIFLWEALRKDLTIVNFLGIRIKMTRHFVAPIKV